MNGSGPQHQYHLGARRLRGHLSTPSPTLQVFISGWKFIQEQAFVSKLLGDSVVTVKTLVEVLPRETFDVERIRPPALNTG